MLLDRGFTGFRVILERGSARFRVILEGVLEVSVCFLNP